MSKGLFITRELKDQKNEIVFSYQNQDGKTVSFKQKIVKINGNRVQLSIDAPPEITIDRSEKLV